METREFLRRLSGISTDRGILQKTCVAAYVRMHDIDISGSGILIDCVKGVPDFLTEKVIGIFGGKDEFSLSLLVDVFESGVSGSERKSNGVKYTPEAIKKYVLESTVRGEAPSVCDPSCGCGSFLLTAAEIIHSRSSLSYAEIVEKHIFGADISHLAVAQSMVLLSLLSLSNGERCPEKFNFVCGNMLDRNVAGVLRNMSSDGFDCVVGNPPYVSSKNIAERSRLCLSSWKTASTGKVDLYIPFFEVGLSLLNNNGILGYITPNTYIHSVNGRGLRNFIRDGKFDLRIVDFRDAQMFEGVSNYCCITVVDNGKHNGEIEYCRFGKGGFGDLKFSSYSTEQFAPGEPWTLASNDIDDIIRKMEGAGRPLSNWKIRNGLATLRNDVFFFVPTREDGEYYYRNYDGEEFPIEKGICVRVAKPNVMKSESDLAENREVAIFPYKIGTTDIIEEDVLKERFPRAYEFLTNHRKTLSTRDKGDGKYDAWYAYGRKQGLMNFGKKLLLPSMSDRPIAIFSTDYDLLFYSGYAVFSEDERELKVLKAFLESDAFGWYMTTTSKPYLKGYVSFSKNYIKNFSLPDLSEEEIGYVLSERDGDRLNEWILRKYGVLGRIGKHQSVGL